MIIHQPEHDPATPALRQGERQQIQIQTTQYLNAGGTIECIEAGKHGMSFAYLWSESSNRLLDTR